jgi:putative oxidoreductase
MNSKILLVIRIVFAVFLVFVGANKLFHFFDPPPLPNEALGYWEALGAAGTISLVGIVEVVAGLSLFLNKYAGLMMIILMSVSVNAVLYHINLDSTNIMMALVLLVLNIVMLYFYKDKYKGILS